MGWWVWFMWQMIIMDKVDLSCKSDIISIQWQIRCSGVMQIMGCQCPRCEWLSSVMFSVLPLSAVVCVMGLMYNRRIGRLLLPFLMEDTKTHRTVLSIVRNSLCALYGISICSLIIDIYIWHCEWNNLYICHCELNNLCMWHCEWHNLYIWHCEWHNLCMWHCEWNNLYIWHCEWHNLYIWHCEWNNLYIWHCEWNNMAL